SPDGRVVSFFRFFSLKFVELSSGKVLWQPELTNGIGPRWDHFHDLTFTSNSEMVFTPGTISGIEIHRVDDGALLEEFYLKYSTQPDQYENSHLDRGSNDCFLINGTTARLLEPAKQPALIAWLKSLFPKQKFPERYFTFLDLAGERKMKLISI